MSFFFTCEPCGAALVAKSGNNGYVYRRVKSSLAERGRNAASDSVRIKDRHMLSPKRVLCFTLGESTPDRSLNIAKERHDTAVSFFFFAFFGRCLPGLFFCFVFATFGSSCETDTNEGSNDIPTQARYG